MTMIVIHGENTSKSRLQLTALTTQHRTEKKDIFTLQAKALTPAVLEEALGSASLFGTDRVVVIEELHSLPESAKKKQLLNVLTTTDTPVILWEKRVLTATMLKKFPQAEVLTFKTSSTLFQWLDSFGVTKNKQKLLQDLHQVIKDETAFFCFTMLCRQVRLLISARDDGKLKGAPFMISKLKKQAGYFSLTQLLDLHSQLLKIDYHQKRSLTRLTLEQELELLVLSV